MASAVAIKHLVILVAVPLSIAAATGLAAGPTGDDGDRVDDHTRPEVYNLPTLPDELMPIPSEGAAEYPLAVTFNPADPSNYTPGGIISHDYVVVHTMQGSYYGSQSWFQNPDADVSAHFCMRSEDGEVTQMVYLSDRAWHVGNSNAYAIGIEHEGFVEEPAWYTWEMYGASALLSRWIADEYAIPLTRDHIVGHVELPNQSHTDPGINWNWDLYMALILDIVGEGRVEGYVVDRSQACTLTATSDTWIKKTLEPSSDLSDTDKCFIPVGTEIEYLHASGDMVGHRRISYEASGHPCEGFIGLDTEGYMFAGHFTATCDDASVAAAGVTVVLDGGPQVVTDANGYFDFIEVGPGPHTLDVIGNGSFDDTLEPIDVDVYPGVRSIIAVDPIAGPGDGDGDPDGGECWIGSEGCPCTDGGGCDPGLVCDQSHTCVPDGGATAGNEAGDAGTAGETGNGPGADGIDYLEGESCSVTDVDERRGTSGFALLMALGLVRRTREGSTRDC
jgi:N-acetyl-anhydromuramyl-L-alanine amidase AmpD